MIRSLLVVFLLALTGCVLSKPKPIDAIATNDAAYVGREIAGYIATSLPAASTTVWVAVPPPTADDSSTFAAAAVASLRERGFAVAEGEAAAAGAHALRFDAYPLDGGVLLRVYVDNSQASRWYGRDASGSLSPASMFTVRAGR
jgi:hypothetical protein